MQTIPISFQNTSGFGVWFLSFFFFHFKNNFNMNKLADL